MGDSEMYDKYPKGYFVVDDLISVRNKEEIPVPTISDRIFASVLWMMFGLSFPISIIRYKGDPPAFFRAHFYQAGLPIVLWFPYFGISAAKCNIHQAGLSLVGLIEPKSTASVVLICIAIFIQLVGIICAITGNPRVPVLWRVLPKKRNLKEGEEY